MTAARAPLPAADNLRASLLMVLAMGLFAVEDALIKRIAAELPAGQVMIMLGAGGALLLAALAATRGVRVLSRELLLPAVLARNAGEVVGTLGLVTAIVMLPLSVATAILQAAPLVTTMGAALILKEPVGWRRWTAILVGLAGVLIVLRPDAGGIGPGAVLAVIGVLGLAARDLATRRLPARIGTLEVATWGFAALIPAGALSLAIEGRGPALPGAEASALTVAALAVGLAAYVALVASVRGGDMAAVAPFRYSRILFGLALGMLAFGERPDAAMLAGCALIAGAGIYMLLREARLRRAALRRAPPPSPSAAAAVAAGAAAAGRPVRQIRKIPGDPP